MATATTDRLIHPDHDRAIDSLLYRRALGQLHGEDQFILSDLIARYDIGENEQAERVKKAMTAKEAYRAERKERVNPDFIDNGVVLQTPQPRQVFLVFTRGELEKCVTIDGIASGNEPIPDLRLTKFHRHPADTEKWFSYLLDVITAFGEKVLHPQRTAILIGPDTKRGAWKIPTIDVSNPPLSFNVSEWKFICAPGQSQKDLDSLIESLKRECERRNDSNLMQPHTADKQARGNRW